MEPGRDHDTRALCSPPSLHSHCDPVAANGPGESLPSLLRARSRVGSPDHDRSQDRSSPGSPASMRAFFRRGDRDLHLRLAVALDPEPEARSPSSNHRGWMGPERASRADRGPGEEALHRQRESLLPPGAIRRGTRGAANPSPATAGPFPSTLGESTTDRRDPPRGPRLSREPAAGFQMSRGGRQHRATPSVSRSCPPGRSRLPPPACPRSSR